MSNIIKVSNFAVKTDIYGDSSLDRRYNIKTCDKIDFDKSSTIYVIRNSHDLDGRTITIPNDCILRFDGGSISNGTIKLNNTIIEGRNCFSNIVLTGKVACDVSVDWYEDDFEALKRCLALTDENNKTLYVTRDLDITYTETIRTSSSIDFQGHTLHVNSNFASNSRLLEFCNTEISWLQNTAASTKKDHNEIIDLINNRQMIDFPEKWRNCIISIYSQTIVEVTRIGFSPQYLNEVVYIDECGDVYGDLWNKDIPYEDIIIRVHRKKTNEISLKNCNFVMTYTNDGPSDNYITTGIQFQWCINATIDNVTVFATNPNEFKIREIGTLYFDTIYNLRVSNLYAKCAGINKQNLDSSYGINMYKVIDGLLTNIKSESPNNYFVWGLTGTNYLYNIKYVNCTLNRIDTHWRVVNMDVDHCDIGYYGIQYTGKGIINVTNSKFLFHGLRPKDTYATYFDGVLNISNCMFRRKSYRTNENESLYGIVQITPTVGDYILRGIDTYWLGARTINIDNVYIDASDSNVKPSIISYTDNVPSGYESRMSFRFPNVNVNNVTYKSNNNKSMDLLYCVLKKVSSIGVPVFNVSNCIDVFTNQMDDSYEKMRIGMVLWSTDYQMFDAILNVRNSNVFIGQEPTQWTCNFTDCTIDGFYSGTDGRYQASYSFNNCTFRYKSTRDKSPFSVWQGPLLRFSNCLFDAPVNESHNSSITSFYSISDATDGWIMGSMVSNIVMTGCMPSEQLCTLIGKDRKKFYNLDKVTKGTYIM